MMACRGFRGRCSTANSRSKSVSTREAWNGEILYVDEGNSMLSNQTIDGMAVKKCEMNLAL